MNFYYFPFTHISVRDQALMGAFLKKVFYLAPDPEQAWSPGISAGTHRFTLGVKDKKNILKKQCTPLCRPDLVRLSFPKKLQEPVVRMLADHRQWAAHSGAGPGQLKSLLRKKPYFTSDTQVSSIRSQIQEKASPKKHRDDPQKALIKALAFLCLARENDEQNAGIEAALSNINEKKHRLFATLAGDEAMAAGPKMDVPEISSSASLLTSTGQGNDPGELMTSSRILSWCKVFSQVILHDSENTHAMAGDTTGVLVTTSPAVIDFFEQISPGGQLLLDKVENYVHKETGATEGSLQDQVMDDIKSVISSREQEVVMPETVSKESPGQPRLKLYVFKGDGIKQFFHSDDKKTQYALPDAWIERGLFICLVAPGK